MVDADTTTQGLLPLFVCLASEYGLLAKALALPSYHPAPNFTSDSTTANDAQSPSSAKSARLLAIATVSASIALACRYTTAPTSALGLSSVIFTAAGLVLFEQALKSSTEDSPSRKAYMSVKGTFSRRNSHSTPKDRQIAAVRDIAFAITIVCGLATYMIEPPISRRAMTWEPVYRELAGDWKTLHFQRTVRRVVLMIFVNVFVNVLVSVVVSRVPCPCIRQIMLGTFRQGVMRCCLALFFRSTPYIPSHLSFGISQYHKILLRLSHPELSSSH